MVQKGLRTVPAEPIRRAIEDWIAEREKLADRGNPYESIKGAYTGLQQAIWQIFKEERGKDNKRNLSGERVIHRLLDRREGRKPGRVTKRMEPYQGRGGQVRFREVEIEHQGELYCQETVTFELADKILSGLDLWHLWHQDPDLAEAYQKLDLRVIDLTNPTCETTQAAADELIWETYLEVGSIRKTAKVLGLSQEFLKKKLEELRAQEAA